MLSREGHQLPKQDDPSLHNGNAIAKECGGSVQHGLVKPIGQTEEQLPSEACVSWRDWLLELWPSAESPDTGDLLPGRELLRE